MNDESFGQEFAPSDLLGGDPEKKMYARNAVWNIAKIMCKENKPRITQNLENVSKQLPSNIVYTVCDEKLNDFFNSRLILDWSVFLF